MKNRKSWLRNLYPIKSTDRNLHRQSSGILAHAITYSTVGGTFQKRLSGRYRPESVTLSRGVGAPARPPTASRLAGRLARRSHRPLLWITAAWLDLLQVVMVILIYQDIITRGPRWRMKKQELRTSEDQVDAGTRRCLARSAQLTGRRRAGGATQRFPEQPKPQLAITESWIVGAVTEAASVA